jgi:uncharacterized membrane protein
MLYLITFSVVAGSIASVVFFFVYKRHIKKNDTLKEKSFTKNAPKIFGSINFILALFIGIWLIINPLAFSQSETVDNQMLLILSHIFYTYFHIFALPLNIGSAALTVLLKKHISKTKFAYYMMTNVIASILLFILTYLILN